MDRKGGAFFSILLTRLTAGTKKRVLHCIPQETLHLIHPAEGSSAQERFPSLLTDHGWMHHIHYSWFGQVLEGVAHTMRPLFISLFPHEVSKKLLSLFGIQHDQTHSLSPFASRYLLAQLKTMVMPKEILATELLPPHPLNKLLFLSKKTLTMTIDLLGMHDVALEIKKIVDVKELELVHDLLMPQQKTFLKKCLKRQVKWTPPPLPLSPLQKDRKQLLNAIHKRGLIRFTHALDPKDKDLIWHVTHLLDTGRATHILSHLEEVRDKKLLPYFRDQVFEAIQEIERL